MTAPCTSQTCQRRETCNRHAPGGRYGTDYSHGQWFEPDHCFFWRPREAHRPSRTSMGTVYGGKTLP